MPDEQPAGRLPRAPAALLAWLGDQRVGFVRAWVDAVSQLGPHYRQRQRRELERTIGQSYEANRRAMASGETRDLDRFVSFITRLRLQAGFPLSEVQQGFDQYRVLLLPRLGQALGLADLVAACTAINACVSYQIHRFSDRFQAMHEAAIRRRAEDLAAEVASKGRRLALSEERYRTLVEEINDGYFAVRGTRIAFANRTFARLHAATQGQVIGQPIWRFVDPADRARVRRACLDALAGKPGPRRLEFIRRGLDGQAAPTEVRSRVVDWGEGPVLIGIYRDMSERVEMERRVRESERLAYIGQLTASLSHELRNPLSTIRMNLQLLERHLRLEGNDRDRLSLAAGEVARLEGILQQLLDLAKPQRLTPEPVAVNRLVGDCLALLRPRLSGQGLRLRRLLDPGLDRLNLDRKALEQALFNLLLNALDAAPAGSLLTVATRLLPGGRGCRISVRDQGPGLSADARRHLFTPFFTSKRAGTGLGLANVKRLVQAHGGRVAVVSRSGRGARFVLEFKELA
ncbi:MAG: two-component system sensor histidine kinase NtrB [Thermodesulfobacteriota bacterium]